jgi:hypothetical protein
MWAACGLHHQNLPSQPPLLHAKHTCLVDSMYIIISSMGADMHCCAGICKDERVFGVAVLVALYII